MYDVSVRSDWGNRKKLCFVMWNCLAPKNQRDDIEEHLKGEFWHFESTHNSSDFFYHVYSISLSLQQLTASLIGMKLSMMSAWMKEKAIVTLPSFHYRTKQGCRGLNHYLSYPFPPK
ncbi:hypothetical protein CHARACLAT_026506 [Characodon lateralis]|uniref:Uncharacterized protein n=1 Tax=Characodon lateralis TaxID=208331 RepID=A0ABU7F702_9TELE|nr:hypothetical protein [Characodon lateralis]